MFLSFFVVLALAGSNKQQWHTHWGSWPALGLEGGMPPSHKPTSTLICLKEYIYRLNPSWRSIIQGLGFIEVSVGYRSFRRRDCGWGVRLRV